jgi:hypothetical protein
MADPQWISVSRIIQRVVFLGAWVAVVFGGAGTIRWLIRMPRVRCASRPSAGTR